MGRANIGAYFSGIASGSLHGWLWLVAGLVPLLIFWVEHKVTQRLRAEHPELVSAGSTTGDGSTTGSTTGV